MPSDLPKMFLYQLILQMAQRLSIKIDSIKLMSLPRSFKGQKDGFQISLALNSTNILEIQAVSPKESFAFAIDRVYLLEHSQFANLIREPVQILQFFESSFQKVTFSEGRLAFPYIGVNSISRNVSILLFRDRALSVLQQRLAEQQAKLIGLINASNEQANIRFEKLQFSIKQNEGAIQSLITKTEDLQRQINQVRQNCIGGGNNTPPVDPAKIYRIAIASQPLQTMDINLNPNDNSNVILWSSSGGANQKWQFEISNNGEYTIVSLHQGLVLELSELQGAKPDQVRAGVRANTPNQKWKVTKQNNGFTIKSVKDGTVLRGFEPFSSGSRVAAQAFSGNVSDTWTFVEV